MSSILPILGLGLSVLELRRDTQQTDRRTDRHRPTFYNAPRGLGMIMKKARPTVQLLGAYLGGRASDRRHRLTDSSHSTWRSIDRCHGERTVCQSDSLYTRRRRSTSHASVCS